MLIVKYRKFGTKIIKAEQPSFSEFYRFRKFAAILGIDGSQP